MYQTKLQTNELLIVLRLESPEEPEEDIKELFSRMIHVTFNYYIEPKDVIIEIVQPSFMRRAILFEDHKFDMRIILNPALANHNEKYYLSKQDLHSKSGKQESLRNSGKEIT